MAIKIKGIIGWDVNGQEFADRLSRMSGDIDFEIDSPGGSVFHGISIYNAIKNYDRGKCRMHVVGQASSMAGYIMMAGDGLPTFEPNAVCVLHNPWTIAIGDYKAFQKEANILERLADLYAEPFVKKGVFEKDEIRQIMDEETWFIGSTELKKLGNVAEESSSDDSEETNSEADKEIKIAACKERIKEVKAKLRELECSSDDLEKIAAFLPSNNTAQALNIQTNAQATIEIQTTPKEEKGEKTMVANLQELKAQKPSIYEEARQDGVNAEQKRVKALLTFADTNKEAVIDAIINGKSVNDEEFQAEILNSRINAKTLSDMQAENPEAVDPKEETHAPEQQETPTQEQPKETGDDEAEEKASLDKVLGYMGLEAQK